MDKVYHRIKGKTEHLKIVYNKTLKIYNKWKRGGLKFSAYKAFYQSRRGGNEMSAPQTHGRQMIYLYILIRYIDLRCDLELHTLYKLIKSKLYIES